MTLIACNPGFYAQVAKPTLCSLAQDSLLPVLRFNISCENVTRNLDTAGHEFNLTLFFKISNGNKSMKVTVHTHHSKRLVQIQGGSTMPSKDTAASWFVHRVLYDKFQTLAKAKKLNIKQLNQLILSSKTENRQKLMCVMTVASLLAFDVSPLSAAVARKFSTKHIA